MGSVLGRLVLIVVPFVIGTGIGALVRRLAQGKRDLKEIVYPAFGLGGALTLMVFGVALASDSPSSLSARIGRLFIFIGILGLLATIGVFLWWNPE